LEDNKERIRQKLSQKGLRVTPQRIAILETIYQLDNHPTADQIIEEVRKSHPNLAPGTVYKVLDAFVANRIIKRVSTDEGVMRYDGIVGHHHHLYSTEDGEIRDYVDEELDELLRDFFRRKKMEGFQIEETVLQIKGKFTQG
jgi:Fur family peroxide stress response transcriptional regulator